MDTDDSIFDESLSLDSNSVPRCINLFSSSSLVLSCTYMLSFPLSSPPRSPIFVHPLNKWSARIDRFDTEGQGVIVRFTDGTGNSVEGWVQGIEEGWRLESQFTHFRVKDGFGDGTRGDGTRGDAKRGETKRGETKRSLDSGEDRWREDRWKEDGLAGGISGEGCMSTCNRDAATGEECKCASQLYRKGDDDKVEIDEWRKVAREIVRGEDYTQPSSKGHVGVEDLRRWGRG